MKKEITTDTNRFLSIQTKQALFFALEEAKKSNSQLVTLKYIFYGLLKVNSSLLNKIISNIYKKNGKVSESTKTLLYRCERSLLKERNSNFSNKDGLTITLSKPVRNLLYVCFRDAKSLNNLQTHSNNYQVITTVSLFNGILKNEGLRNWLINEIFMIKTKN